MDSHKTARIRSFFKEISQNRHLYLMALPVLLYLSIFAYLPIAGHLIAFKRFNVSDGIFGSPWAGLENFKFFFLNDIWYKITFNTLYLNALFIVSRIFVALVTAILLNEIQLALYKKLSQSIIFLPYFISWMVISLMVFAFLNTQDGLINGFLAQHGLDKFQFYSNPEPWPAILTIVNVWKFSGYESVIFLAAIAGISEEYYESARIDGASRFQQILHITIPMIRPVVIVLTLLAIGRIFYGDFGMIYGIIGDNGVLYSTTDIIDTYSYRALRMMGNFSMSSAVVLYQSIMGLITIIIFNAIVRKVDPDSRLF